MRKDVPENLALTEDTEGMRRTGKTASNIFNQFVQMDCRTVLTAIFKVVSLTKYTDFPKKLLLLVGQR